MAHFDNSSTLLRAAAPLLSFGVLALERVSIPGHNIAIDPLPKLPEGSPKHTAVTILVQANGKPCHDAGIVAEVRGQLAELFTTLHPSDRAALELEGLRVSMRKAATSAPQEAEVPEAAKAMEAVKAKRASAKKAAKEAAPAQAQEAPEPVEFVRGSAEVDEESPNA